jgi:hypothetical protein
MECVIVDESQTTPETLTIRTLRTITTFRIAFLRSHIAAVLEFVTAVAAIAAILAHFFVSIPEATFVELTLGILALLAITSLAERATKMADVERKVDEVDTKIAAVDGETREIGSFLRGPTFDRKLTTAVAEANSLLRRFQRAGIKGAYEYLSIANLVPSIRRAYSVRILSNWVGGLNELGDALTRAAANNCNIRILILRHDSEYARTRSLELSRGGDDEFVANQIANEISQFDQLFKNHPETKNRILVKAYDASPTLCLFAYDKIRLIGLFWRGELVMNTPFLKVHGEMLAPDGRNGHNGHAYSTGVRTAVTVRIDEHFESLWCDPETRFIRLVNGKPDYVDSADDAWSQDPPAGAL